MIHFFPSVVSAVYRMCRINYVGKLSQNGLAAYPSGTADSHISPIVVGRRSNSTVLCEMRDVK